MNEKCFCHFNGYEVKDAKARKEKLDNFSISNKVNIGSELLTDSNSWITNEGWSGNSIEGFTHIIGKDTPLIYNNNFDNNKKYLLSFDVVTSLGTGLNASNDFSVILGNTKPIPTYRGGGSMHYDIALYPSEIGTLQFICVDKDEVEKSVTTFNGTIKNISLKEISGEITPLKIYDENNEESLNLSILNKENTSVILGQNAGISNYNTKGNVYIGNNSGKSDITGYHNVAVGGETLRDNINGSRNVALGYQALPMNVSGDRNISIGCYNLAVSKTGRKNIALGFDTLNKLVSGNMNLALGNQAMGSTEFSKENIAIGTGASASAQFTEEGIRNIALGDHANNYITSGYSNIGIGYHANYKLKTGNRNIALGNSALNDNELASRIIAIGESTGSKITSGEFGVIIGQNMGGSKFTTINNSMALGISNLNNIVSLNNSMLIGNRITANTDKVDFSNVLVINAGTNQVYINKDNYMNIANLLYGNISATLPQVGIGQTEPTAKLHLGSQKASSGTAPLKFTANTVLMGSAEDGAFEYDGTHLYFTIGNERKTII